MDADVAHVASLMAEPARARMIAALMNGRSLPAGELAALAHQRPKCDEQTAWLRHCYSHMAGAIAVAMADAMVVAMVERPIVRPDAPGRFRVAAEGKPWFDRLGVRDTKATSCIDWTERRPHLGGPLGVSLFHRFIELG